MNIIRYIQTFNFIKLSQIFILESLKQPSRLINHSNMPLVVPDINSGGSASETGKWQNKLVGKKIGEGSDEVVFISFDSY